jgi:isopenicillin N synthase-like dioxygenase
MCPSTRSCFIFDASSKKSFPLYSKSIFSLKMTEKVPSISIQNLRHSPEERHKLLKGLTKVGFLYICDHGVPESVTERVKKVSPDVFLADKWERQKLAQWRDGKLSYGDIYNEKDKRVVNERSNVKLDKKEIDEAFFDYLTEMYRIGLLSK